MHGPFLVIGPLNTLRNWVREFAKFAPDGLSVAYVRDADLYVETLDGDILRLFYKESRHEDRSYNGEKLDKNFLMVPLGRRRCAKWIKDFFNSGTQQKIQTIKEWDQCIINTEGLQPYTASQYCSAGLGSPPPTPVAPPIAEEDDPAIGDTSFDPPSPEAEPPTLCTGINIQHLEGMRKRISDERFEELTYGFADTQREAMGTRLKLQDHRNIVGQWDYNLPVIGALVHGNDQTRVVWTCTEIDHGHTPHYLGNEIDYGQSLQPRFPGGFPVPLIVEWYRETTGKSHHRGSPISRVLV